MPKCWACCQEAEPVKGAPELKICTVRNPQPIGLSLETSSIVSEPQEEGHAVEQHESHSAQEEGHSVEQQEPHSAQDGHRPRSESQFSSVLPSSRKRVVSVPSLEGHGILRATSVGHVLSRGGSILQNSSGSAQTYELSEPRQWIDIFISHNWVVPRWRKFWALALYFNVARATMVAYICVGIGCVLNALSVPPLFQYEGLPLRPYCTILGTCGFWLMLVFGHDFPLAWRLCCQRKVFLDKICIHQTDPVKKAAGINNLGAFLRYSNKMLVLFNAVYCKRLWTVYEMACYMYLHRDDKDTLELLPVGIASVVLKITALVVVLHSINFGIVHLSHVFSIDNTVPVVISFVMMFSLIPTLAFILRSWTRRQSELLLDLREFQISKADCFDEKDRALVSGNICAFARSMELVKEDASDEDALTSFDKLVRERMPELLRRAVGYAGFPYKYALVAGIGHDFHALDLLSSSRDAPALSVGSWVVYFFSVRTAVSPAVFLVCALLSMVLRPRKGWAEVGVKCGIGAAAIAVAACLGGITLLLEELATHSVGWLITYAVVAVVQALVVARLFQWNPGAADPGTLALAARQQLRDMSWGSGISI